MYNQIRYFYGTNTVLLRFLYGTFTTSNAHPLLLHHGMNTRSFVFWIYAGKIFTKIFANSKNIE